MKKIAYEELLKKYNKLLEENKLYRERYGSIFAEEKSLIRDFETKSMNKHSSSKEKIELYMSLFVGRQDVYAKRWESKKTGKSGYAPVCINEWKQGLCDKPNVKCSLCKNRDLERMTDEVIKSHLLGSSIVGIYPLLEDETCTFLAMDFDKADWKDNISAVVGVCDKYDIPTAVERSRSGNGAHIWIFFESRISAKIARRMGTILLTKAMEERDKISFDSYDRLFPNQDIMPKGGFGNLIALPLQKFARNNGNSVFVNEDFEPFEDQWHYISSIEKISFKEVDNFVSLYKQENELGELDDFNEKIKPWEKKTINKVGKNDFAPIVKIVKANMIYINKKGLSPKAINKIKRIASFSNPDFYKAQAMRLPVYDKPRVISLADENEDYIFIPRGCIERLIAILEEIDVDYSVEDETYIGNKVDVSFNGELRENQNLALSKLTSYDNGIIVADTAFGKTVVGAHLVSQIRRNTLIIVHTKQLMAQWKERLKEFLIINETIEMEENKRGRKRNNSIVGEIGGGKDSCHNIIDIAIMQSLSSKGKVKDLVKNYGLVIVDECHRSASFTYEKILETVNAKYVYGLTATPIRRDGQHPIALMCIGGIRYKSGRVDKSFDKFVIPRFTKVKVEETDLGINHVFAEIVQSNMRNNLIVDDAVKNYRDGKNILLLTERTGHLDVLHGKLLDRIDNLFVLSGRVSKKKQKEVMDELNSISERENVLLLATGRYIGEGFDYPRLDTLQLTFPISWSGNLQQYAGRLNRDYKDKKSVTVLDYVDIHVPVLNKMHQKRLRGYKKLDYQVKSNFDLDSGAGILFDENNYYDAFTKDIERASKKIVISSPSITKVSVSRILDRLLGVIKRDVSVFVITKHIDDYSIRSKPSIDKLHEEIKSAGVKLVFKQNVYQKFIVVDNYLVWFGSINILGYNNSESMMRIQDKEVARELIGDF